MSWPWEIAERDHDIQNPTSPAKIRLLGDYLRLTPASRVLDIACGKAGPALVLASAYGCRIQGIELRPGFAHEARARIASHGLESLIDVQTADAAQVQLEPESWDASLCLGASSSGARSPMRRPRSSPLSGKEAVWRSESPTGAAGRSRGDRRAELRQPRDDRCAVRRGWCPADRTGRGVRGGLGSLREPPLAAIEEWLAESRDHPDADDVRRRHVGFRGDYLRFKRELLGWAIFVGRKV
ncbi:MAG: methyltransferase domain-containing protein [Actinobacteria bacterium]|nr:methyltransferase domain-containing protein [Actinomycetota bacterium]